MVGIRSLGWYFPSERHPVGRVAADNGVAEKALADFGLRSKVIPTAEDHPSTLAARAAQAALSAAGLSPDDVDLLIFSGITRDQPGPWVAAFGVLHHLGAHRAAGFDLSARCPGIHDALWVGASLVRAGSFKTVLVATGDRFDYLFPPGRRKANISEAVYSAGGAAVVLGEGAENELVAYSHCTNQDLSLHAEMCPRAGGSRWPMDARALEEHRHEWQNAMTPAQGLALRDYLQDAERHNIGEVRKVAGFDEIDFVAVSPLDVKAQIKSLAALGIDESRLYLPLPVLGHMGPADSLISIGGAIQRGQAVGPRLVMSSRSVTSSSALAIRGRAGDLGIKVEGPPIA